MTRRKKKKNRAGTGSRLSEHKQYRKTLKPPLADLPMRMRDWARDELPDFLWLDSAISLHNLPESLDLIPATLDVIDADVPPDSFQIVDGTIRQFALVPPDARASVVARLRRAGIYDRAFPESFRQAVFLHEACPARWIIDPEEIASRVNRVEGLEHLRSAINRLFDRHGEASRISSTFALARWMKHGKFHTLVDDKRWKLFPDWPFGLNPEQRREVELLARHLVAAARMADSDTTWAASFWRCNRELSQCEVPFEDRSEDDSAEEFQSLPSVAVNVENFRGVLNQALLALPFDLYATDRDDVLGGLMTRQFRLFEAVALNPALWVPEIGNLFGRIMADTLILCAWLAHRNDPDLFARFKSYSLGRLKLYKLKMEEAAERDDADIHSFLEDLQQKIDEEIYEEMLTIDLGKAFENIDTRKMASEVDLSDTYSLVFSPMSADVHGEWVALKDFYLTRCVNPLHRWHRVPALQRRASKAIFPSIVIGLSRLLQTTIDRFFATYAVPVPDGVKALATLLNQAIKEQ